MTGKQLIKLMRTENVTIRELAARRDMPMTRVRFRRETVLHKSRLLGRWLSQQKNCWIPC
jgi:hypothetical protein